MLDSAEASLKPGLQAQAAEIILFKVRSTVVSVIMLQDSSNVDHKKDIHSQMHIAAAKTSD